MLCSARAMVVDDRVGEGRAVGGRLVRAGFDVRHAVCAVEALREFERADPDIVVTAFRRPRLDGIDLVRNIRSVSNVPVVMMAAVGSLSEREAALRIGVDRVLEFGRDLDRLGVVAWELIRPFESHAGAQRATTRQSGLRAPRTAAEARPLAREERRAMLARLLVECRGNIAEMARRMGRDRSTVRYHLRRMGMLSAGE